MSNIRKNLNNIIILLLVIIIIIIINCWNHSNNIKNNNGDIHKTNVLIKQKIVIMKYFREQ